MDSIQLVLLALLQGFTEFLPISSSAHLILFSALFELDDQGLVFDVAVHIGSLIAVVWYFRNDIVQLFARKSSQTKAQDQLLSWVMVATLPAALVGWLFAENIAQLRNPLLIACTSIGFGVVLWLADRYAQRQCIEYQLGWRRSLLIGVAQILALIPGTSRSGITISAGLMLGLTRKAAARFSFLLSIPLLSLAGSYSVYQITMTDAHLSYGMLIIALALSLVSSLLCIQWFIHLVERIGMLPFVLYRIGLGLLLLAIYGV